MMRLIVCLLVAGILAAASAEGITGEEVFPVESCLTASTLAWPGRLFRRLRCSSGRRSMGLLAGWLPHQWLRVAGGFVVEAHLRQPNINYPFPRPTMPLCPALSCCCFTCAQTGVQTCARAASLWISAASAAAPRLDAPTATFWTGQTHA